MPGATLPFFPAGFVFPGIGQCLVFAAPFLAVAAVWWLIKRTERIVDYLLPDLEWEKSLGWLNIRARRRADTALRWLGYAIYALLAVALYGIVWAAEGLQQLDNWSDPWVMGDLALRVPVLLICMGLWLLYLGGWLIPKLRVDRERKGLKKYRAAVSEIEEEGRERVMGYDRHPPSRLKSPLPSNPASRSTSGR